MKTGPVLNPPPAKTPPPPAPTPAPTHTDHRLRRGSVDNRPPASAGVLGSQPLAPPTEPPQPALTNIGFAGGINEFNQRVQTTHDTFLQVHGYEPSPGLVLDIARSGAPLDNLVNLLAPTSATHVRAQAAVSAIPPEDALTVRHDGYIEHSNPVAARLIAGEVTSTPEGTLSTVAQPSKTLAQYQALQKQHPWVAMGMLPLPGNITTDFWNAVKYAQDHPGATAPLTIGGESLGQYERENQLGESLTGQRAGETPGLYSTSLNPASKATTATPSDIAGVTARMGVAKGVSTVSQAQDALKRLAPDFFVGADGKPLPSSGFINTDWAKAIGKYQSSATYFRQQTVQLSKDNHFGDNTSAFIHAWKAKQAAIKAQPFLRVFIEHQPLAFFDYRTHGAAIAHLMTGDTKGWGWSNLPTIGLGALVHTAGLALNELAGTIDQAKVDASFVSAYMQAIAPKGVGSPMVPFFVGKGQTEQQARQTAMKVLSDHPNWVRVFDPNYNPKGAGGAEGVVGSIANVAVDLMLGGPKFTGEKIAAGDLAAARASRYFGAKTTFAFNALKEGKLGEAVASLEGGAGAESLNARLEAAVKSGDVSLAEYQQHAAQLYAHGFTTIGDQEINGPLFASLRGKDLPTPAKVSGAAKNLRQRVNEIGDQWENTLRARKQEGATSHAANFIASVRQLTARVSPAGQSRHIFADERLPQDVYNWARTELNASPAQASSLRDEIIRIRASNDVQAAVDFGDKLRAQFMAVHPKADLKTNPVESAGAQLESESRSYLHFPASLETRAAKINSKLNAFGRIHRQTIVSGSPVFGAPIPGFGESLAWKHAVADTTRRVVGGGGIFPVSDDARALVDGYLKNNPAAIRGVGVAREQAEMGENRWITGKKMSDPLTFRTGDTNLMIKGDTVGRGAALKAAGGYLRHNLTSDALKAYQASTKDDLQPLVNMIMRSRDWRGVLKVSTGDQAEAAAEALWTRYREIEEAGQKAGLADPLNEALGVLIKNKGAHADQALGKWIGDNKIDMPVREGLVERSSWDDVTQWWIGKLMTANKWNRRTLFDHVFYGTTQDLVKAGWTVKDALPVAADLAKRQTIYHMLDFSNMLQVEQNLRWLSYFATKHRLYWSWILKQAARRPGLAAGISDVQDHIDSKGNINFGMLGHEFQIPVARLFWVNSTEYPQTSAPVQFLAETGKGIAEGHGLQSIPDAFGSLTSTSGNLFTRDDQAEMMGIKLALVATGHLAPTSDAVTAGMSPTQKLFFERSVNEYSAFYRAHHGVYPSEADAVKHALLASTAQEAWRSNLFLPVTMSDPSAPSNAQHKLLQRYGNITNPAKKRAFLDAHPDLALLFGVSQDPAVYLHNGVLWDKFNAAQKWLQAQRAQLWQQMVTTGYTPATKLAMKRLSDAWSAKIDQLKLEDAATWQGSSQFPAGKISDGQVVTPGPWGVTLEGDPLAARAFVHQSFPGIKPPELNAHTVGENIVQLQQTAALFRKALKDNNPAEAGQQTIQQVHDTLANITARLAPFFSYPKDAPGRAQSLYYSKYVAPYIKQRDATAAKLKLAPQDQQDALRSQFRAWKDQHDHPVTVTVDGHAIKFPSVVQIGWSTLPPDQRHLGLAQAVSGDWSHVASYEKTMLGVQTPASVSAGWSAYYNSIRQYSKNPTNPGLVPIQKTALAKQIDKYYPGFYKDYLFSQEPKLVRFQATSLYRSMPDRKEFDQYVVGPAKQVLQGIKTNGNRRYYEKAWRNYVETQLQPWIDGQPALKKELADYGPDFLNTLVSG